MAEVRLIIEKKQAKLTLVGNGETVIDEESWVFPSDLPRIDQKEAARAIFDEAYDYLNFLVHGLEG